ncbi:MAG TPA: hypothetical protein VF456_16860 [Vicinamibacterales bacterium]
MASISRAEFLRLIALGIPAWALTESAPVLAQSNADRRRRISNLIQTYDGQGIHRTATIVDNASADWLRQLAAVAGGDAHLSSFPLRQVNVQAAYIEADGKRIEGVPFFDGGFTGDTGIVGTLGSPDSMADIALVTIDSSGVGTEGRGLENLRRSGAHRAIVAVTASETAGLTLSNAGAFANVYGVPVLQVASENQAKLTELAASGARITYVAAANRNPSEALNVVVNIAGRRPDLAPVVVMTPRSGWWQCASERGGGLACWMESIRAVSAAKPVRPAIFIASSGHELGHYGLDAFLKEHPALIKDAAAWIHLGANIGAAGGQMRLQASDDEVEGKMVKALDEATATVRQRVPRGTVPAGEARNIHVGGGRYVSLLGSGKFFHTQQDRWPVAVDVDAVTKFATAVSNLAVALAGQS